MKTFLIGLGVFFGIGLAVVLIMYGLMHCCEWFFYKVFIEEPEDDE